MHIVAPIPTNPMEELEKNKKLKEKGLSGKELYELKKEHRGKERQKGGKKEKLDIAKKKTGKYTLYALVIVSIIGGISWFVSIRPNLPPTTAQGHTEASPPSHIVTTPIADAIQRHMLEHSDGGGAPGIIIQYNCEDYDCEPDLIEKLTQVVEEYPNNVYLAPSNYDGKIILTRIGGLEILDNFDEQVLRDFINR